MGTESFEWVLGWVETFRVRPGVVCLSALPSSGSREVYRVKTGEGPEDGAAVFPLLTGGKVLFH